MFRDIDRDEPTERLPLIGWRAMAKSDVNCSEKVARQGSEHCVEWAIDGGAGRSEW